MGASLHRGPCVSPRRVACVCCWHFLVPSVICVLQGTKMIFAGLKKEADRANLVAFLKEATA